MKTNRILVMVSIALAAGITAVAADKHANHGQTKNAAFEKIKALKGVWEVKQAPSDHGPMKGTVSYKVTAGGSAVLETLFGGSDHEMVTLYYVDGEGLAMTHYCMLGNRPQMRAEPKAKSNTIVFQCEEGSNSAIESEDHMHQITFTFVDPDHIKSEWVLYKGGKSDSTHTFELARKKK